MRYEDKKRNIIVWAARVQLAVLLTVLLALPVGAVSAPSDVNSGEQSSQTEITQSGAETAVPGENNAADPGFSMDSENHQYQEPAIPAETVQYVTAEEYEQSISTMKSSIRSLETALEEQKQMNLYLYITLGIGAAALLMGIVAAVVGAKSSNKKELHTVQENLGKMAASVNQLQSSLQNQMNMMERKMEQQEADRR